MCKTRFVLGMAVLLLGANAGRAPEAGDPNLVSWGRILLSDLTAAGVKTTKIQKITIGVGDRNNSKAGDAGMLFIDDIGYRRPSK
jgi:hypothetical protein